MDIKTKEIPAELLDIVSRRIMIDLNDESLEIPQEAFEERLSFLEEFDKKTTFIVVNCKIDSFFTLEDFRNFENFEEVVILSKKIGRIITKEQFFNFLEIYLDDPKELNVEQIEEIFNTQFVVDYSKKDPSIFKELAEFFITNQFFASYSNTEKEYREIINKLLEYFPTELEKVRIKELNLQSSFEYYQSDIRHFHSVFFAGLNFFEERKLSIQEAEKFLKKLDYSFSKTDDRFGEYKMVVELIFERLKN